MDGVAAWRHGVVAWAVRKAAAIREWVGMQPPTHGGLEHMMAERTISVAAE